MPMKLSFAWSDVNKADGRFTRNETETANVHFEYVSIVFQLAAVHSQLAAAANLKSDPGVKDGIASCKAAAGLLLGLQEYVASNFSSSPSPDFDKGVLQFFTTLMGAQGLECVLAKVFRDCKGGKSPVLAAKIANQAAKDFGEALAFLKSYPVLDKRFRAEIAAKENYYRGESHYWQGEVDVISGAERYGKQVSRLEVAHKYIAAAAADAPWARERCERVKVKLEAASKDNRIVYMERTLDEASLEDIGLMPAHMIMSTLSKDLPDFAAECAPGLFAALVSVELTRSAEEFRKQQGEVVDRLVSKLSDSRQRCVFSLGSWNLPAALDVTDNPDQVPPKLIEASNLVQQRGGIGSIVSTIDSMPAKRRGIQAIVDEAIRMLDDEEREESDLGLKHKDKWTLRPSSDLTAKTRDEGKKIVALLGSAETGDKTIAARFDSARDGITVLSGSPADIAASLPSAVERSSSGSSKAVGVLREKLAILEALRTETDALEKAIRDAGSQDDIIAALTNPDLSAATVIQQKVTAVSWVGRRGYRTDMLTVCARLVQVQEFVDTYEVQVDDVVAKTSTALNETEVANGEFVGSRAGNANREREEAVTKLLTASETFTELCSNAQEAEGFYAKIEGMAKKLNQKVADFCDSRRSEKKELLATISAEALREPVVPAGADAGWSAQPPGPYGAPPSHSAPPQAAYGAPPGGYGGQQPPYGGQPSGPPYTGSGGGGPPYGGAPSGGHPPYGGQPYGGGGGGGPPYTGGGPPYGGGQPYSGGGGGDGYGAQPPYGGGGGGGGGQPYGYQDPHANPYAGSQYQPPPSGPPYGSHQPYSAQPPPQSYQPPPVVGSRGFGAPAQPGVLQLQEMFPGIPRHTLEEVLARQGGDVQRAINECLSLT